jgi:hypothetical protein
MTYHSSEVNLVKYWRKMDGVPQLETQCQKLMQGQLLMQRYWYVHTTYQHGSYSKQAETCKEKSMELARRMVAHAKECATCQQERALESDIFYGIWRTQ